MGSNFRNYDLTVDEIMIVKLMEELIKGLESLEFVDPLSPRAEFFAARLIS